MAHALGDILLLIAHADLEHPLPWEIPTELSKCLIQIHLQRFLCSVCVVAESSSA